MALPGARGCNLRRPRRSKVSGGVGMSDAGALARHLLRRAGFGTGPDELASFGPLSYGARRRSPRRLRRDSRHRRRQHRPARLRRHDLARRVLARHGASSTRASGGCSGWCTADRPLQEKMTLFWHNHFATGYTKIAGAFGGDRRRTRLHGREGVRGSGAGCAARSRCCATTRSATSSDILRRRSRRTRRCSSGSTAAPTRRRSRRRTSGARSWSSSRVGVGYYTEAGRVRGGARVHGLEPGAAGHAPPTARSTTSSSTTRASTRRAPRRSAFRSIPTAARRFRRGRPSAGMQDGLDLIDGARRAIPNTAQYLATKLYRFFVSETATSTARSSTAIASVYLQNDTAT